MCAVYQAADRLATARDDSSAHANPIEESQIGCGLRG
jgi:hypothetical protein